MNLGDIYLSKDEARAFLEKHKSLQWVDIIMFDLNGIARGKRYRPNELVGIADKGLMVPSTVYILDPRGNCVEETGLLWETGDPDLVFRILAGTLVPVAVNGTTHAQCVIAPAEDEGGLDPRRLVQRQVAALKAKGLTAVTAVELEFYIGARDGTGAFPFSPPKGLADDPDWSRLYQFDELDRLKPFIDDVYKVAEAQGLPIGAVLQESGPAQFEINLNHCADPVQAALDGLLLKRAVRAAAGAHNLDAIFMAKPHHNWSGCGMHVHVSLVDDAGANAFSGDPISPLFRNALGGLQATMGDFMAVWAQSANAYRRYVPKSYVAMAAHWGMNNRNVALRIPRSGPSAVRVEHRVSGADANPYLAMAGILAGIRHGIDNKLEPGPMATGDATACDAPGLPTAWVNALQCFSKSAVVKDAFGERFQDVYCKLKTAERIDFERTVTALDHQWYSNAV
ncbi:MAG: glutamine synthetase family protein [Hyphomicrobium sp.]